MRFSPIPNAPLRARGVPARLTLALAVAAALCLLWLVLASPAAYAQDDPGAGGDPGTDGGGGGGGEVTPSAAPDPLFELVVEPGGPPVRSPIAVVSPNNIGASADTSGVEEVLFETVRRDLEISGLFEVVSPSTYGALVDLKSDGHTATTINFDGWYLVGATLLVKGTYAVSGEQVEIDLRLFDVDQGSQIKLNWSPTTVRTSGARAVAHDFVNAIIEHFTGERGVFGTRVLFTAPDTGHFRRIYSVDNAGFGLARYDVPTGVNVLPSWGPGGSILYTALTDQGDNLFQFDGEENRQLTHDVGYASGAEYCASAGLIALTVNTEEGTDIYVMKADGSEMKNLTQTPDIIEASPSWGPGCSRLAYVSDESGRPQIYIMNVDGSGKKRVTWAGNYNTTPSWSPKGDLIAFTARDERRRFDIFTIEVSSGHITRITQDQGNNEEPSWSPDGRYLVFQSTRDGRQPRLYLSNIDGRWQTRILDMPGARTPVWAR